MNIAAGDAGNADPLAQTREPAVTSAIAWPIRPLQLDPEVVGAEGAVQALGEGGGSVRFAPLPGARHRPLRSASREANEALGAPFEDLEGNPGRRRLARLVVARVGVRLADQPTEVAVAGQ